MPSCPCRRGEPIGGHHPTCYLYVAPAAAPGPAVAASRAIDHDALELHRAERLVIERARQWRWLTIHRGAPFAIEARIDLMRALEMLEVYESRKNPRTADAAFGKYLQALSEPRSE